MRLARAFFASVAVFSASALAAPSDAGASVSIAVGFDALVKDADAVAVVTPQESRSVWEDGRIYTYTRVKVDQGVAGDLGSDGWVRTMGGVVGKIGQMVDGEAVLTTGRASLVFVHRFKAAGTWEVSARAQGQFPVVVDDSTKLRKVIRSSAVGVLLPPKPKVADASVKAGSVQPQSVTPGPTDVALAKIRLAGEVIPDRPLDDVTREIALAWKKAHASPVPSK